MLEIVHLAIPAFLVLLIAEAVLSTVRAHRLARGEGGFERSEGGSAGEAVAGGRTPRGYAARDTAASLTMGVGNVLVNLAVKGAILAWFAWLYQFRVFELGEGWPALLAAVVAVDFVYYWYHRAGHEVRFFWAAHVSHHSSRHYNLSTALRQTWTGWIGRFLFYWPLPLLGFHPLLLLAASSINLIYQFWIHTEYIDRLPHWFEAIFNTPSHHRVHHGTNPEYLDRNHAGILIVWDRLFGTFEPEHAPVDYGLTKNLESYNPFVIAFHEWRDMLRDAAAARSLRELGGYVLGPPGWRPEGRGTTARELRAAVSGRSLA